METEAVKRNVDLVGFVDLKRENAADLAQRYGVPGAVVSTHLRETLKASKPEAVFDCTIPEAHGEVTLVALKQGCHVLGEKPMADSMVRARRMLAAAERAGRIYAVIQNRRYQPGVRAMRALIESGAIGTLTTLQSNFFLGAHFGGFRDRMRHVLLLDMAIHTFDMARLISGADAQSVFCHEWNPAGSWYAHGASAIAVFTMTHGVVYSYEGSWCAEGCPTSWEGAWRIVGTKGTLLWDGGAEIRLESVEKPGGFMSKTKSRRIKAACPARLAGGHNGCIMDFLKAVRGGPAPETICTDNIRSLAMVHAAVASAEKGRVVKVA